MAPKAQPYKVETRTEGKGITKPIHMNRRMWAAWDVVVKELGFAPRIVQGGYRIRDGGSAKASFHTHDRGGCIDTNLTELTPAQQRKVLRVGRKVGWAVWIRTKPPFDELHMHWVLLGDRDAHQEAKDQMASYKRGKDGLDNESDDPQRKFSPDPEFPIFNYNEYLKGEDMKFSDEIPGAKDDATVGDALRAALRLERSFQAFRRGERARAKAVRQQIRGLQRAINALPDEAVTKAQLKKMLTQFDTDVQRTVERPDDDEVVVETEGVGGDR